LIELLITLVFSYGVVANEVAKETDSGFHIERAHCDSKEWVENAPRWALRVCPKSVRKDN
jgi:hypothetical protein